MKVAVIGSRTIHAIPLEAYLPPDTTELVSGGAKGVDQCAETYAAAHQIKLTVFLPDYARYRRGAPLRGRAKGRRPLPKQRIPHPRRKRRRLPQGRSPPWQETA